MSRRMTTGRAGAAAGWSKVVFPALLLVVFGCQSGGQSTTQNPPPVSQAPAPARTPPPDQAMNQPGSGTTAVNPPGEPPTTIPAATAPKPKPKPKPIPKPKPKPPAPAPAPAVVTVPAGTSLKASLNSELRSDKSPAGTAFTLSVVEPLSVGGAVVIPAGSTIHGNVVSAKASGKSSGKGEMTLAFTSVVSPEGVTRPIAAETFYAEAESGTDADVARIAGGAAAGAIIGGLLGGKKGAGVGGLIGAAAGTGTVLATTGPQVKLATGQLFEVKLTEPLDIPRS